MKLFIHPPVNVKIAESYEIDKRLYERFFEANAKWLENNDIDYQVHGFRYPELLCMLARVPGQAVVIEFTVTIEDDTQAMMFKLFSELPNDT